jgi:hypothetical protein
MEIHSALTFEPVGEATRVTWASELEPRGWLRLLRPILGLVGRRQAASIYSALKRTLEETHE